MALGKGLFAGPAVPSGLCREYSGGTAPDSSSVWICAFESPETLMTPAAKLEGPAYILLKKQLSEVISYKFSVL
jgi:hypothetical protein